MDAFFVILLVIVLIIFAAALGGLLIMFLTRFPIGSGGNWKSISERYAREAPPSDATIYNRQTVRLGCVTYKNCVSFGVSEKGLYMRLSGFLGAVSKLSSAFIPWSDIKVAGESRMNFRKVVVLEIAKPAIASMTIFPDLFELIQPHLKSA